ncbi:MAG: hypothetical protein U0521_23540 [Anaerolineae bacterium]
MNTKPNTSQQLREVLHVIATQAETDACVSSLLEFAMHIGGVVGVAFGSPGDDAEVDYTFGWREQRP